MLKGETKADDSSNTEAAEEKQEEDGEPFEEKIARLTGELSELFAQSHTLEAEIRQKLTAIGYEL